MILGIYGVAQNSGVPAIAPYDLEGNQCGISPGYEQHRFLFFTDMGEGSTMASIWDSAVCVKNCILDAAEVPDCKPTQFSPECKAPLYATMPIPVMPLFCGYNPAVKAAGEPDIKAAALRFAEFKKNVVTDLELSSEQASGVAYMVQATPALIICMVTAGIFSIMWIYAMANCATGIAYVVIGCCELMLVAGIIAPQLSGGGS
jgi:hypothetical protein